MASSTVVSSPGKVLIAGGYLVLDPAYPGVVVSTSSRFYTVVSESGSTAGAANTIQVRSPQFLEATWNYTVNFHGDAVRIEQSTDNAISKNKFVQLALQSTLSLIAEIKGASSLERSLSKGIDIAIVGDNDFYSQREQVATYGDVSAIPPFTPCQVHLADVHKTGLGSSAALITSLTTALLLHFGAIPQHVFSDLTSDGRRLAHNLAQYVHCLAQGKVGSGFDVSAAVFGSQRYTRFNPAVLQPLMSDDTPWKRPLMPVLSPSNPAWDYHVEPFQLPPYTRILLADVDAGSDTPSLVGKVLKWRSENSEQARALWTALDQANQSLCRILTHLSELYSRDPNSYIGAIKYISSLQPVQWLANPDIPEKEGAIIQVFYDACNISQAVRGKMREMGKLCGVPIEPPEQTSLLDACVSQAGVIGGGVPGAGGYDAIWLLLCDPKPDFIPDHPPVARIQRLWSNWKGLRLTPLAAVESTAKGVRLEQLDDIPGLKEAIREN